MIKWEKLVPQFCYILLDLVEYFMRVKQGFWAKKFCVHVNFDLQHLSLNEFAGTAGQESSLSWQALIRHSVVFTKTTSDEKATS